ncbi:MAG: hypothetical protein P4L84_12560 [Isosphaeraceae bacterium]|nr:hypothetical protein [Isosphaeraceae bacterium]
MIELLAVPAWNTPPSTLDAWTEALRAQGVAVNVERDPPGAWLEVASLRLRGYALSEGLKVEAINFELSDTDSGPATRLLEAVAASLGWEIHPDEDDETDED